MCRSRSPALRRLNQEPANDKESPDFSKDEESYIAKQITKAMKIKILSICCGLLLFVSCTDRSIGKVDFLIGTWKMESKNQYETWRKASNYELIGYSYEISENQKKIQETIAIKMIDNRMTYEATVPDQNEGKTIQFALNPEIKSYLSFENLNHDFPKKIQYHRISDNEITIKVVGDDDKGFSYKLIKQENE